jgi:hypothetical protein
MTGISYVTESAGHIGYPVTGSCVAEDGSPADFSCEGHYPITAECTNCHQPIRLTSRLQMEWSHVRVRARPVADAP